MGFTSVRPFPQLSQAGFLASVVPAPLRRLYQLLLFTLPGTPVFNYGDEIGLEAASLPGQVQLAASPWGGCVGGGRQTGALAGTASDPRLAP